MRKLIIPKEYNYVGVFLTFACNMNCDYCINNYNRTVPRYKPMDIGDWITAINRIETRSDLPITLQGGEPTCYPGFYDLVDGIEKSINLDILTNGLFNVEEFMKRIPPDRMKRSSKYASIRFSYHPGYTEAKTLLEKVSIMQRSGYSVGIWAVDHPEAMLPIGAVEEMAKTRGLDFRIKEFLGAYDGKLYGTYKYPKAVRGESWGKRVMCRPSELLIAPDGGMFECHYHLYSNTAPYAYIHEKAIDVLNTSVECKDFGLCNVCDIKLKFDRYQRENWCSVTIV